jgi:hypothetical protein
MKTEFSADIIDFATAAQRLRLRKRRCELQRLRAAHAAHNAACAAPAAWQWFPAATAAHGPARPLRHVVAR